MNADEHRESPTEADYCPCPHMEETLNALADGSLRPPLRWLARLHVLYCTRCRQALATLRGLRIRLQTLRHALPSEPTTLSRDRKSALDAALNALDAEQKGNP